MCIVLVTTSHADYPFILLSNRDEYLNRPTAKAEYWATPHKHVLGGRDLQREAKGTWLGITKQGRIAALTNFHEEGADAASRATGVRSRGELPLAWLTLAPESSETAEQFAKRMVEDEGVQGVGGFSLLFGRLRKQAVGKGKRPLGIISNRTPDIDGVVWPDKAVYGLSNSRYGDHGWPKVVLGEEKLANMLDSCCSISSNKDNDTATAAAATAPRKDLPKISSDGAGANTVQEELLQRFFALLATDTYPEMEPGLDFAVYSRELRKTIFVPVIGESATPESVSRAGKVAATADEVARTQKQMSGLYGTQKQTVIMVDWNGKATFVERTIVGPEGQRLLDEHRQGAERRFEFQIEGWNE